MMILPWIGMETIEEIGSGAFGTVYLVEMDGKEYALKIIRIPQSEEEAETLVRSLGSREDAAAYYKEITDGFTNEIRILHKFKNNPNIVNVLDYRIEDLGTGCEIYILMEALETFTEYEITHKLEEKDVIRLGTEICQALESCEKEKIVHRDLKPDNILVSDDGTFKICDFGVAKNLEKSVSSNSIKGTFTYMAPEVYHGKKYDHRADLYSLGLIMYRMVNGGKEPFIPAEVRLAKFKDKEDALNRRMDGEALPVPAEASEGMAEIILKACAYYPGKRYQTASEMKEDLARLRDGKYVLKNTNARSYGKRRKSFYLKSALMVLAAAVFLGMAGRYGLYMYREKYVNYCDTEMQARIMEENKDIETTILECGGKQTELKGCHLGARLNGNGVLYIENNDDLLFNEDMIYPWAENAEKVKTIVFGENVTKLSADPEDDYYLRADIFEDLKNLEAVIIKGNTFRICGSELFSESRRLKRVETAPDTTVEIEGCPFLGTPWEKQEEYQILGKYLVRYNGKDKQVHIPSTIKTICSRAFSECDITSVTIPEGVKEIQWGAFGWCEKLKSISIPASVEEIGGNFLTWNLEAGQIHLAKDNPCFTLKDGVLYDKNMTRLISCPKNKKGSLIIPEGVLSIDQGGLNNCDQLTEIHLPEGLLRISNSLFYGCSNVKRIDVPDSVMEIDIYSLEDCTELEELKIGPGNRYYTSSDSMIYDKSYQKMVYCYRNKAGTCTVRDSVKIIDTEAFKDCNEITEIVLPEELREIHDNAFAGCGNLKKIDIPKSVTMIELAAFLGDKGLEINYGGSEDQWDQIADEQVFMTEDNVTVHYNYRQ